MKKILFLAQACLLMAGAGCGLYAAELSWEEVSRGNREVKSVLVDARGSRIIYLGTRNTVFKSEDSGGSWRSALLVKGQNSAVNFLAGAGNILYAATGNGLFKSDNQGRSWSRIFRGRNYLESEATALGVFPQGIYLGTQAGLFMSADRGRTWQKAAAKLGKDSISAINYHSQEPNCIYVAGAEGLFRTENAGKNWERIFISSSVENHAEIEEMQEGEEEERNFRLNYLIIDPHNLNYLYLATTRGVYLSPDKGKTWNLLSDYGLLSRDVKFLLMTSGSELYAMTETGIFEYKHERWLELSFGLSASRINQIASDNQRNLYAACDEGLFKAESGYFLGKEEDRAFTLYNQDEPQIQEVQEAAIKYAEVDPQKIIQWRKKAAGKAILPKITVAMNRDVADLWHWEAGSSTKTNDDVLTQGNDAIKWEVSASWDLSDLIWTESQTSIDVRSRLMVQLREDILDEVTKIYFERLRVERELDNLSIEERKKRAEKELRLRELTAYLDGLTGGYFSRALSKTGS